MEDKIRNSGEGPNGLTWNDEVLNNSASAPYTTYIGGFSGHNGRPTWTLIISITIQFQSHQLLLFLV